MSEVESLPEVRPSRGQRRGATGPLLIVIVLLIAALVGEAFYYRSGHSSTSGRRTITVTGSGSVIGQPDTVNFQIGVQTIKPTATASLSANNTEVASLESTLVRNGVTKKDLQTSGLDIYANTSHGVITGFTVTNTLEVTLHDVAKAGGAIDAAANAVGNDVQFNGVSLSMSNQSSYLAAARAKALAHAATTAAQLARAAGEKLGPLVSVVDHENQSSSIVYPGRFATANGAATSILPGTQTISVTVTAVFQLG